MKRTLPAPARIAQDLDLTLDRSGEIMLLARKLADAYEQAYDFGLSGANSGSIAPARTSWVKSDPTGDIATSARHAEIRRRTSKAARNVLKARTLLELAEGELIELWFGSDLSDPYQEAVG